MLDIGLVVLTGAAALYMMVRSPVGEFFELLPIGAAGIPLYLLWFAIIALGLLWRRPSSGRTTARAGVAKVLLYAASVPLIGAAATRGLLVYQDQQADEHWPPRFSDNRHPFVDSLTSQQQAKWAAHVAEHAMITGSVGTATDSASAIAPSVGAALVIPSAWPMPSGVRIARRTRADTVELWARTADGAVACVARPSAHEHEQCTTTVGPDTGAYLLPQRSVAEAVIAPLAPYPDSTALTWPQYRFDAARIMPRDTAAGATDTTEWAAHMDGPARSSVSLAGNLVLIGAHGSGSVEAFDRTTGERRWQTRVPSWVHMDITSDGRTAAVGFGDNALSFTGRAPSGMSVFDVQTGRLRWTHFDESSVMSGAVIRDNAVVYATALGVVRRRSLETGALLAEDSLPGGVVMAPAAMRGDTVVYGLEHDHVCAILASTLKRVWCRRFEGMRMMGHAAPAILGNMVVVTASQTIGNLSWSEFRALPLRLQARLIYGSLFPNRYYEIAGQRFFALRLSDGGSVWASRNYTKVRNVDGHTAGTSVLTDSAGLVVLPQANVVVGFDPQSGVERWTAGAHLARGPALITHGRAIVAGTDGKTEVRDVKSGALTCTMTRRTGHDRAGAASDGRALYFVDRAGMIERIAIDRLLGCRGEGLAPA